MPAEPAPEKQALLEEFARLCAAEESPRIEDLAQLLSPEERSEFIREALAIELRAKASAGHVVDRDAYCRRFPQHRDWIEACLAQPLADASPDVTATLDLDLRISTDVGKDDIGLQASPLNQRIGRYRILKRLGQGGFGAVYSAQDEQLDRQVAIKVTLADRLGSQARDQFLTEARIVASLDHPNIVPVLDVGESNDGNLFVVSKLISGSDLAKRIQRDRPTQELSLAIVESVADALHYAHGKGLVHRDIKPGNILLDESNRAYLADFGLALRETDKRQEGEMAGTPAYMSPEQARGEGHRVDNRSDIYSLGVVLYELLTGRRPFRSDDKLTLIKLIASEEVRTPRIYDSTITGDLERICLKALARRAADRFQVACDLADELRWLRQTSAYVAPTGKVSRHGSVVEVPSDRSHRSQPALSDTSPLTPATAGETEREPAAVIPKGLRSFDANDADFFLRLLPGPFDREGLPQTLRFWKSWVEESNSEVAEPIGLIYGPSGCGKSSLIKAGLIPRLHPQYLVAYVEATPEDTETTLFRAIRSVIPDAEGSELVEVLSLIRRQRLTPSRGKLILIIDQFEQWLYATSDYAKASLTNALRQCDGVTTQAIVMVRDDFWLSVSRFLRELGVRIIEAENSGLVDLFDIDHAKKVLGLFGQAYGKLPASLTDWTKDQERFLDEAVAGLAEERKVISVRLAIFAEMMRSRAWTPASLKEVGGIAGVGVTFLEETFASQHAPPQHRLHQRAIQEVLSALLPAGGTNIKGHSRSVAELRRATGYDGRDDDFQEVIELLDRKLHLITPVDLASLATNDDAATTRVPERQYQLTHDYLVPAIREWLARKLRETKEGRALLRLQERTAAWIATPNSRNLPSLWEWFTIRRLTDRKQWKPRELTLMRRAGRVHTARMGGWVSAIATLVVAGVLVRGQVVAQQERARVQGLVAQLSTAEPSQVPGIVRQLDAFPELALESITPLLASEAKSIEQQRSKLHAQLALVARDASLVDPVLEELLSNKVAYIGPIRDLLQPHAVVITSTLQAMLGDPQLETKRRFRAGAALAGLVDPTSKWNEQDLQFIATQLVSENAEYQPVLRDNLRPISAQLLSPIEVLFKDPQATDAMRLGAANALADFGINQPELLMRLLADATPEQFRVLYSLVEKVKSEAGLEELKKVAASIPPDDMGSLERISFGQRRANAAVSLLRLGERESVLPVFDYTDDPEALTQFIFRCKPRGIGVETLLELLDTQVQLTAKREKAAINSEAFQRDSRIRYAIILALGEFAIEEIPLAKREPLIDRLSVWYANDASSGVHGACGWLLRKWNHHEVVTNVDRTALPYSEEREWFTLAIEVTPNPTFYFTFIVFPPGETMIGSVEDEPQRSPQTNQELRHVVRLTRPFALLDRELTIGELIAFSPEFADVMQQFKSQSESAAFGTHWYDSVSFCRWLTTQAGLSDADQAYVDPESLDEDEYPRDPNPDANLFPRVWPLKLGSRGFRLPTESEWEVACRSGARTTYGFGSDVELLSKFGWFQENSGEQVHLSRELRPSPRGLFDMQGNLFEWTHDWDGAFSDSVETDPLGPMEGFGRIYRGGSWISSSVQCRAAFRFSNDPTARAGNIGFRLVLDPSATTAP